MMVSHISANKEMERNKNDWVGILFEKLISLFFGLYWLYDFHLGGVRLAPESKMAAMFVLYTVPAYKLPVLPDFLVCLAVQALLSSALFARSFTVDMVKQALQTVLHSSEKNK